MGGCGYKILLLLVCFFQRAQGTADEPAAAQKEEQDSKQVDK